MTIPRILLGLILLLLLGTGCDRDPVTETYTASGLVSNRFGEGIAGVKINVAADSFVVTDEMGIWQVRDLIGENALTPEAEGYTFSPTTVRVTREAPFVTITAQRQPGVRESQIFNWFSAHQLPNGLLESVEDGNVVSLYDQALAAMVFMLKGEHWRARKIFDFFLGQIDAELRSGVGGYAQFRDRNGTPNRYRWMGDNAWLLIALNNYKSLTGDAKYDEMAGAIADWLMGLQDADGGLFAGYGSDNARLEYKVTEGIIDAFNAIPGYTDFHRDLLGFLEIDRWDATDRNLLSWPTNPTYRYALDCHSWSYCIFEDYPVSSLTTADRFLHTKVATSTGLSITGFDIDEDRDMVFIEGTGQMAVAYNLAGKPEKAEIYLLEMEQVFLAADSLGVAGGFPYASNPGTGYGSDPLWPGADTEIAISGGAWYLFGRYGFSPFAVGRDKFVPLSDRFWND